MILNKLKLNIEIVNAIFIIVLNTFLILTGFTGGFILPLFLLIMLLSFGISLVYPRSGIYAVIFLTLIFERFFTLAPMIIGYQEYKVYPLDIILGAVFLAYFFQLITASIKSHKKSLVENKYLIMFFVLVAVHFLVDILIIGTNKLVAFSSFKYYVFYPWLYFVALFFFKDREYIKILIKFFLAGTIGIIFFIIFGLINGGGLWTQYTPLSTGGIRILAFTHSFYILMGFLGVWIWNLYQGKKMNLVLKIIMAFWMIGIVGSMMRHLWIGAIISLGIIYILVDKAKKNIFQKLFFKGIISLVLAATFFSFVAVISPNHTIPNKLINKSWISIEERASSLFSDFSQDESFSWRELVWRESLKKYSKNPIWGLGFGQKIYVESDDYKDFVEIRNIHNSWLVLLFQSGIIIFGLFCLFVFKSIWKLYGVREKSWEEMVLLVLAFNYLIVAIFQPYFETNMLVVFFWIILGLIGSVNLSRLNYENFRNK